MIGQAAERLRRKIVINRVCRQSGPSEPLVGNSLRSELASAGADRETVAAKVVSRMMTADDLQSQIAKLWAEAERDVDSAQGEGLLAIAPGEEILDAVFQRFAMRKYNKRRDGPAIASAMKRPEEIAKVLDEFLAE